MVPPVACASDVAVGVVVGVAFGVAVGSRSGVGSAGAVRIGVAVVVVVGVGLGVGVGVGGGGLCSCKPLRAALRRPIQNAAAPGDICQTSAIAAQYRRAPIASGHKLRKKGRYPTAPALLQASETASGCSSCGLQPPWRAVGRGHLDRSPTCGPRSAARSSRASRRCCDLRRPCLRPAPRRCRGLGLLVVLTHGALLLLHWSVSIRPVRPRLLELAPQTQLVLELRHAELLALTWTVEHNQSVALGIEAERPPSPSRVFAVHVVQHRCFGVADQCAA